MSLNNTFVPQYATNPLTGQIFMVAPPNQQIFIPRYNGQSPTQPQQIRPADFLTNHFVQDLQHHLQSTTTRTITQQLPHFAIATTAQPQAAQINVMPEKSVDETNYELKKIKEKCVTHYIDGQIIIETSKPLSEKKARSHKKKKSLQQKHQNQSIQSDISQRQDQPMLQQATLHSVQQQRSQNIPDHQLYTHQQHQEQQLDQSSVSLQSQPASGESEDVRRVRDEMPSWSVSDVVEFIERHEDIKQYSSKFAQAEVDGKALLLMIDRNLNLQILTSMFKYGPAMKIEAVLSKYKIKL